MKKRLFLFMLLIIELGYMPSQVISQNISEDLKIKRLIGQCVDGLTSRGGKYDFRINAVNVLWAGEKYELTFSIHEGSDLGKVINSFYCAGVFKSKFSIMFLGEPLKTPYLSNEYVGIYESDLGKNSQEVLYLYDAKSKSFNFSEILRNKSERDGLKREMKAGDMQRIQ